MVRSQTFASRCFTLIALLFMTVASSLAAPTWMGVYGSQKHYAQWGQEGRFSIILNDAYHGLHAEVGIRVNGGDWQTFPMNVHLSSGRSYCDFYYGAFLAESTVEYYFHAWDNWGFEMWDVNYGYNYSFTTSPTTPVKWLGYTTDSAANGYYPRGWISIKTETWPAGSVTDTYIVYTSEKESNWQVQKMWYRGQAYNNDTWEFMRDGWKLGKWIEYAIVSFDGFGNAIWDNNGGMNYRAYSVSQ